MVQRSDGSHPQRVQRGPTRETSESTTAALLLRRSKPAAGVPVKRAAEEPNEAKTGPCLDEL